MQGIQGRKKFVRNNSNCPGGVLHIWRNKRKEMEE
jgi:hypothetical protein